ncbi:MAG: hypothetical protein U9O55_04455 [Patescibacteria group bacterium]|nr:hypothetical protein [Patescibacteria group bacterium]
MGSKEQKSYKLIEIFLIILGIGVLFLGFARLNVLIKSPFNAQQTDYLVQEAGKSQEDIDKILELKGTDTDKDGLSDYDELNVYHTSMYIADSDSDGYSDKQEIDIGEDPNCPRGKNCVLPDILEQEEVQKYDDDNINNITNAINDLNIGLKNSVNNIDDKEYQELNRIVSGGATLEEVKQLLSGAGMQKDDLEKVSDEDIMGMYQDMVNEMK